MDESRKPARSRAKAAPSREVRVDLKALALVGLAVALAVPALFGVRALQGRAGRSALLLEARKQRDVAHRPDLALGYLTRYLELDPGHVEALGERAELLAEAARDPEAIEGAIRAHVALIGKGARGPTLAGARKRLASLYLRSHQFRAAEQSARDRLAEEPGDVEARRALARALEGSGRLGDAKALEAAAAEFEAAEALQPGDVASGERLASLYLDKFADKAKANRVLDALLEHNPRSAAARLARSRCFASSGDSKAASEEIAAALEIDPTDVETRLLAASEAARRGDPLAAKGHLAAIQPSRPNDLRIKVLRGQVELLERHADRAIRDWRDGLALSGGSDADLTWKLAYVLIQLGRPREAEPLLSQYRRLAGGEEPPPAYRYLVGLAALQSGRTSEAIADLEAIRYKLDRALEAPLHLALGRAYEAARDSSKAADAYQRATASPDPDPTPWLALARLQAVDGPSEPIATLERGIAAVGPDERLLAELARAHRRKQAALPPSKRNWFDLEQVLERAERAAPNSVDLALVRADHATTLGRPEDGLAVLEAAGRRDPASPGPWLAQAEALASLGRVDEAIARLERATATAGEQAAFRIARARFALSKGEVKAAQLALVEGLGRIPDDQRPVLLKALGDFHRMQGDRIAARTAWLDWAALEPESVEARRLLLDLAIEAVDDRAIDREVEALKAIGGASSPTWKVARAEALLRDRPGLPPSPAMLDEAARLIVEVEASTPGQAAGPWLEGRLMEHRGDPGRAIRAYERAIDRKAGPLAVAPLVALLTGLDRLDEVEALRSKVGGFSPEIERRLADRGPKKDGLGGRGDLARRLSEGDSTALDLRIWRARALSDPARFSEVEKRLVDEVDRRPEDAGPWLELMMSLAARGDRAGAASTIDRMMARVKATRPELFRALCCRAAGLRDLADRAFLEALRIAPDDPSTLRALADHEESTGRPERAEPLLRRAMGKGRGPDWARHRLALNLAGRASDRTSWLEAMDLIGEASDASDTPDDRLTRGVVLSLGPQARRGEAVAILQALALERPDVPKIREALARALLAVGDRAGARGHADRAARALGAQADTIRLAASLGLLAGDLDSAARQLDRLEPIPLDDLASLELKARLLKARGQPGEAVALLEIAFESAQGSGEAPEVARALVSLLTALDEPQGAERIARKAAAIDPNGPLLLAEWLGRRGRFDEAATAFDEASKEGGSNGREAARSALTLASTTREPRWLELADRLLDRAIGPAPPVDELAYARASLRHLQGRLEEAVKLYDDLASKSPNNLMFLNNNAWILSEEMGRPLEGLERIEALIARQGGRPHTLDTRGVIFLRLERTDRAIGDLELAAGAVPSGPVCYHLARAYLAAGRRPDAARAFARGVAAGLEPGGLQPSERAEFARVSAALQ